MPSSLVCSGCGASPPSADPYPFRCPNAGVGDVDHVLVRVLEAGRLGWPSGHEENPFLRYRTLLRSYHAAIEAGLGDAGYCSLVAELDAAIAAVDGHGFSVTPFERSGALSEALGFATDGGVWVKDETHNVSGSHKARHLMGVALHLAAIERTGRVPAGRSPRLAIASCGNAALAAAVVARAARREIEVFVPTDAPANVVARLRSLGATVTVCPRDASRPGDPTYHRLREATAAGALPFTCQGGENGLVIEGGETLGWEMVSSGERLDRIVVQVGGGALASAVIQSMREAVELGALPRSPRIDTVQTSAAFPLKRAFERIQARVGSGETPEAALHFAATHRSGFMWPWETAPHSVAHGILDDETYDWMAVAGGMLRTGGAPVVVDEPCLEEANLLARESTGVDVDHTGSSGLAGLLALRRGGSVGAHERVAVLFTGVRR